MVIFHSYVSLPEGNPSKIIKLDHPIPSPHVGSLPQQDPPRSPLRSLVHRWQNSGRRGFGHVMRISEAPGWRNWALVVGENPINESFVMPFYGGFTYGWIMKHGADLARYPYGENWLVVSTYFKPPQTRQSIGIIIRTRMENKQWLKSPISERVLRFDLGTNLNIF